MNECKAYCDQMIRVDTPKEASCEWHFFVESRASRRVGPFPSYDAAKVYRDRLFKTWQRVAIERNGWLWKMTEECWVATIPEDKCGPPNPIQSCVVTRHHRS